MRFNLLSFGAAAGILFFVTIYILAIFVPDYSHFSQTVSEIGEVGSPVSLPFQIAMLVVNACVILCGVGLFRFSKIRGFSVVPAVLVCWFGIIDIGTNVYPSPHPLHNVFGLLLIFGYLAPMALAITWGRYQTVRNVVLLSGVTATLLIVSIFLNISPAFARDLYPLEFYGVIQRSAFVLFYGWLAIIGLRLGAVSYGSVERRARNNSS